MQQSNPIAVLPPVPLSLPYALPQPLRAADAAANVTARMAQREAAGMAHGGRGGARANRQLIYSRYRPLRTFRTDSAIHTCAAFLANSKLLAAGAHGGGACLLPGEWQARVTARLDEAARMYGIAARQWTRGAWWHGGAKAGRERACSYCCDVHKAQHTTYAVPASQT